MTANHGPVHRNKIGLICLNVMERRSANHTQSFAATPVKSATVNAFYGLFIGWIHSGKRPIWHATLQTLDSVNQLMPRYYRLVLNSREEPGMAWKQTRVICMQGGRSHREVHGVTAPLECHTFVFKAPIGTAGEAFYLCLSSSVQSLFIVFLSCLSTARNESARAEICGEHYDEMCWCTLSY